MGGRERGEEKNLGVIKATLVAGVHVVTYLEQCGGLFVNNRGRDGSCGA